MNSNIREFHPYGIYKSGQTKWLIIGTFPIGKFTNPKRKKEIKPHEIDFFYGGEANLLWSLLGLSYHRTLDSKKKIIDFLEEKKISMADVIKSCRRKKGSANDSDLYDIEWNSELGQFVKENHFEKIYFTSQKAYQWFLQNIGKLEGGEAVVLLSPSASGVRSFPRLPEYKEWAKTVTLNKKPTVFRELFYQKTFY
ncbi:MAG: hypothetical protein PHY93_12190 [Bacteriovorax sp.]|nr:hypothetical protein [Bacteriovorax sp.]